MATTTFDAPWYFDKKSHLPLDAAWPRRIFSYQNLPDEFRMVFPETSEFPYTVYFPEERSGMLQNSPSRLITLTDEELVVMSRDTSRKKAVSKIIPLDAIVQADYGTILLQSWLTIRTASQKTAIPFPSVAKHLFRPMLDRILAWDSPEAPAEGEPQPVEAKLGYLKESNLKLFNAARAYLDREQAIVETAYQPEVELSSKRLFGVPVYSKYLTGHLSVLTETAIMLIKESQSVASQTKPVYGESMTYLPVRQIRHIAFEDTSHQLNCVMNVILTDNSSIRTEFSTDMVKGFEDFEEACLSHCVRNVRKP